MLDDSMYSADVADKSHGPVKAGTTTTTTTAEIYPSSETQSLEVSAIRSDISRYRRLVQGLGRMEPVAASPDA